MIAVQYLQVRKSTLPGVGMGLFTRVFIEKRSFIIEYKGTITTWEKVMEGTAFNGYVFFLNRDCVIDAMADITAIARYANDANGDVQIRGLTNNAEYVVKNKKVYMRATADIHGGDEILVDYGKAYWEIVRRNQSLHQQQKQKKQPKKRG